MDVAKELIGQHKLSKSQAKQTGHEGSTYDTPQTSSPQNEKERWRKRTDVTPTSIQDKRSSMWGRSQEPYHEEREVWLLSFQGKGYVTHKTGRRNCLGICHVKNCLSRRR